tara:strand:- start:1167 stop:1436 length:270 start_codon:yes stop_codon:yes gene_type:complete
MSKKLSETELLKTLRLIADCDPPFHAATKTWDVWDWQRARQQHIEVARKAIEAYEDANSPVLTDAQFRERYEEANRNRWESFTKTAIKK